MRIKATFNDGEFTYQRNKFYFISEKIKTDELFKLIKKKCFRWKTILGNICLFFCFGGFIGYFINPPRVNDGDYFVALFWFGFIGIICKSIGKTKIKYKYPEGHPYPKLMEKFKEFANCSYTLNMDNLYESHGLKGLLKIKPNIILGSDKEKNVIQYNALLLPDFLCFNTGGTFGQNYEQIDYCNVTVEYSDTVSVDLASVVSGKKNYLTDTVILAETWLHTNKDGSPDKRRVNNPKIPIFEAASIYIKFTAKNEEQKSVWCIVSDRKKSRQFVDAMAETFQCKSIIKSRDDWEAKHYMAYMLIFIASGVDLAPEEDEKKLLIKSLGEIFDLSEVEANDAYDMVYSYYLSIRANSYLGIDTRQVIIREYFTLLENLKDGKQNTLETVYKVAYDIANADNEIDDAEKSFLDAMKQTWGVDKGKTNKPKQLKENASKEVNIEEELEKYNRMKEKGLISDEDYESKKKELLGL
jgi:tellurite resistance protein|tara:strand:- start:456 stop:1865 length:1410 start_codon:yes stop_codon:yes gene_type:complete